MSKLELQHVEVLIWDHWFASKLDSTRDAVHVSKLELQQLEVPDSP